MRLVVLFAFMFVGIVVGDEETNELPLAEQCDEELCKLPDCRCSSTDVPGGFPPRDIPQLVVVTFDGAVNAENIQIYREVLYNRRNWNYCHIAATFFVSHEHTDYQLVNELYNQGYEIGLNSISHRTPQDYWRNADYDTIKEEIGEQKLQISHFANIPADSIHGVRLPFLQMSGNASFQVMADYGLTYDNSWPTLSFRDPSIWPYSLDYASPQDCLAPPCPTASIPNTWVQPIIPWIDLQGLPCVTADSCANPPNLGDAEAWFRFIVNNFQRHYFSDKTPFGIHLNVRFLENNAAVKAAYIRFFDTINQLLDVYMVNANEAIDWVKNPTWQLPYRSRPCKITTPRVCTVTSCRNLTSSHNQMTYSMTICNPVCPVTYPWTGNPLGQ